METSGTRKNTYFSTAASPYYKCSQLLHILWVRGPRSCVSHKREPEACNANAWNAVTKGEEQKMNETPPSVSCQSLYLCVGYTPARLTEWPGLSEVDGYFCFVPGQWHKVYISLTSGSLQLLQLMLRYKTISGNYGFPRFTNCVRGNTWYFRCF